MEGFTLFNNFDINLYISYIFLMAAFPTVQLSGGLNIAGGKCFCTPEISSSSKMVGCIDNLQAFAFVNKHIVIYTFSLRSLLLNFFGGSAPNVTTFVA